MKMRVLALSLLVAGALADCSTVTCGDNLSDLNGATGTTAAACCEADSGYKISGSAAATVSADSSLDVTDPSSPECATGYTAASTAGVFTRDAATASCTELDGEAIEAGDSVRSVTDYTTGTWTSLCKEDKSPVCHQWVATSVSGTCIADPDVPGRYKLDGSITAATGAWVKRGEADSTSDNEVDGTLFDDSGNPVSMVYSDDNNAIHCEECITGYEVDGDICSPCDEDGAATYNANTYSNSGDTECEPKTCDAGYELNTSGDDNECDSCSSVTGQLAGDAGWKNAGVDCKVVCNSATFYFANSDDTDCELCSETLTNWANDKWSESAGDCTVTECVAGGYEVNDDGDACEDCPAKGESNVAAVESNSCTYTCDSGYEQTSDKLTPFCEECDHGKSASDTGVDAVDAACDITCSSGYYSDGTGDSETCTECGHSLTAASTGVDSVSTTNCEITATEGYVVEGENGSADKYADNTVRAAQASEVTWNDGCTAGTPKTDVSTGDSMSFTCCDDDDKQFTAATGTYVIPAAKDDEDGAEDTTFDAGNVCTRVVCGTDEIGFDDSCNTVGTGRKRKGTTAQYPEYDPEDGDSDIFDSAGDESSTNVEHAYWNTQAETIAFTIVGAKDFGLDSSANGFKGDGTYSNYVQKYDDAAVVKCDLEYGWGPAPIANCNNSGSFVEGAMSGWNEPRYTSWTDGETTEWGWVGACVGDSKWYQIDNPAPCATDYAWENSKDCLKWTGERNIKTFSTYEECNAYAAATILEWANSRVDDGPHATWQAADPTVCPLDNIEIGLCGADRMEDTDCVSEFKGSCAGTGCTSFGRDQCTDTNGCTWTKDEWKTQGDDQTNADWWAGCSAECVKYFTDLTAPLLASCGTQKAAKDIVDAAETQTTLSTIVATLAALGDGVSLASGIELANAKDGDNYIFEETAALMGIRKNQGTVAAAIILNPDNIELVKGQVGNFGITENVITALEDTTTDNTTPGTETSPAAAALYTAAALAAAAFAL